MNVSGFFSVGQLVIPSHPDFGGPSLPRTFNGSMFVQAAGAAQGRIWWASNGGTVFYVNSSGVADTSEYFRSADRSLAIGEIVALDPDHPEGVRRARPRDAATTVGIVSEFGTRGNDNAEGTRGDDPEYVNVGLLGQVPVLVTLENGPINPGDPLTLSSTVRGRATKALGPVRIIGYAMTRSTPPADAGERGPGAAQVMCYLNPGWYAPTDLTADGVEPPRLESAFEARQRSNRRLTAEAVAREAAQVPVNPTSQSPRQ